MYDIITTFEINESRHKLLAGKKTGMTLFQLTELHSLSTPNELHVKVVLFGDRYSHMNNIYLVRAIWVWLKETSVRLWIPNWQQLADIAAIGVIQIVM